MPRGSNIGYNGGNMLPASNVPLPAIIKCASCRKRKPPTSYSDVRQNDLRTFLARNPSLDAAVTEHVTCRNCTGGQVTELECHLCDKWLGLDRFNKAQRKIPDRAICNKCGEERKRLSEATTGEDYDDYSDIEDDGDDSGSDDSHDFNFADDVSAITESVGGVALDGDSTVDSSVNTTTGRGGGGGTIYGGSSANSGLSSVASGPSNFMRAPYSPPHMRELLVSVKPTNAAASSTSTTTRNSTPGKPVFDPSKYGKPRGRSPTSSVASKSTAVTSKNGWAKPPSGKKWRTEVSPGLDLDDVCVSGDSDDDDGDNAPFCG